MRFVEGKTSSTSSTRESIITVCERVTTAGLLVASAASAGAFLLGFGIHSTSFAEAKQPPKRYRTIPRKEVEKHKTADTRIWVTYGEGVYDITGTSEFSAVLLHTAECK
jgi:hypothetical protein